MTSLVTRRPSVVEREQQPETTPQPAESASARHRSWIGSLAAFSALVAAAALVSVAFWPGHMNLDTLDELGQARAGRYNDWHSAVLEAMWHLLMSIGLRSPGWVLAGGVLTLLAGLYLLLRVRLSRPWAALAAVMVLVFPPVLGFDVEIGTDAWFAAFIVCGFGFALRCARTRGGSRALSAAVAVACAFLAEAARSTAMPAVLALLCAVVLVTVAPRWQGWRRLLGTAGLGIAGTVVVFGSVLGLQRFVLHATELHAEQGTYDYDLVQMSIMEHRSLLPPDIYRQQDVAYLEQNSSVVSIDPLWFAEPVAISRPADGKRVAQLQHAWLAAIRQYPLDYVLMRLHNALWELGIEGSPNFVYQSPPQPPRSGFRPAFPALHDAVMAYVAIGTTIDGTGNTLGGPLQRVWVYVLVLMVVVAIGLRRCLRDKVLGLLGLALLAYSGIILLLGPAVMYRYMYPAVATGTVLFVVLAATAGRWLQAMLHADQSSEPGPSAGRSPT